LVKSKKLPLSLITEPETSNQPPKINILDFEKFEQTFGPKSRRIKPKLQEFSIEDLAKRSEVQAEGYDTDKDLNLQKQAILNEKKENRDKRIEAGQSKRIWEELYKVIDSSDVICMVLDGRDPEGTRCKHVENHLKNNCKLKHLVLILNKTDLIPTSATKRWVAHLSKDYPTVAFHASLTKPFGRNSLL
jgi:nuclear GTP-binding protein